MKKNTKAYPKLNKKGLGHGGTWKRNKKGNGKFVKQVLAIALPKP